jgi:hypothetical protein
VPKKGASVRLGFSLDWLIWFVGENLKRKAMGFYQIWGFPVNFFRKPIQWALGWRMRDAPENSTWRTGQSRVLMETTYESAINAAYSIAQITRGSRPREIGQHDFGRWI